MSAVFLISVKAEKRSKEAHRLALYLAALSTMPGLNPELGLTPFAPSMITPKTHFTYAAPFRVHA